MEFLTGEIIRVNDATEVYYLTDIQSGTREWVPLRGPGFNVNTGAFAFRVPIQEASNRQLVDIPLPYGCAIDDLKMLSLGINIPVRNVTMIAVDGYNYSRLEVYQPYQWFDTNMDAAGVVTLKLKNFAMASGVTRFPPPIDGIWHSLDYKVQGIMQDRRKIWK